MNDIEIEKLNGFLLNNGLDYSDIGLISETIILINDCYYDYKDIMFCYDNKVNYDTLQEHYDYALDLWEDNPDSVLNLKDWLKTNKDKMK